jgi:glutamate transport system ATP-binding protein
MTTNQQSALGQPVVVLKDVDKHFGDLHVLKNINLTIHAGEVVVVIGPSGSGKSTLCRTINRLETYDAGTITLDGQPLPAEGKALAKLRAEVGMVFQSFNLFAHKTILENVTLGPIKVRKQKPEAAKKRALELLERVGVVHQAPKYPAQLSGGQQQRVAIARALATAPDLVFADEPTGNLDSRSSRQVLGLLAVASREGGQSIAMVTHDPIAAAYADRVLFLGDGRIVADKPRQTAEQIAAFLLAAEPAPETGSATGATTTAATQQVPA